MQNSRIIKALESLPPGDVYLLGSKAYVLRGFEYYRNSRVDTFEWAREHEVLYVRILGTRRYTISISMKGDSLKYYCTCPAWSPGQNCKHVVCAVITIKNLVNESHFREERVLRSYRQLLKNALFNSGIKEKAPGEGRNRNLNRNKEPNKERKEVLLPGYSIVIERENDPAAIIASVWKDDIEVKRVSGSLPEELRPFVFSAHGDFYYRYQWRSYLETYLREYDNLHPLFVIIDGEKIPVKWDEELHLKSKTLLDISGEALSVSALYLEGDSPCSRVYRLNNIIVVDLETGRMGHIKEGDGLRIHQKMISMLNDYGSVNEEGSLILSAEHLDYLQLSLDGEIKSWLDHMVFRVNGEEISPEKGAYSCRMTIDTGDELEGETGRLSLLALCDYGGDLYGATESFFNFIPYIEKGYDLSQVMRAKKRKKTIIDTFIKSFSIRKKGEFNKLVKEALSNGDYRKRAVRSEAKHCLGGAYNNLTRPSSRLHFREGKWTFFENDLEKESFLYSIPYDVFGVGVFSDMPSHYELRLPSEELYMAFHLLSEKLSEKGIPLYFNKNPVRNAHWDFVFNALRKPHIDWFDVSPEINFEGAPIDDAALQKALSRNGVLTHGDEVLVLDSNTRKILSILNRMGRSSRKKEKKKEIVRVPRLQILDWVELRKEGVEIRLSADDEKMIERLCAFEKIEKYPLPEKMKAKARHYQKEGYYWLAFLYEHRFGACLADDMGLGKTLQAIMLLAAIKEKTLNVRSGSGLAPHLIVVPPSLLFNWQSELEKFYAPLKVFIYQGVARQADFEGYDIVLTTYGLVRRDIDKLEKMPFHVIIFDEAQAIKNIHAATTGAVRRLKGEFKLVITGTPLENHLGEYYSILDLALPELLGDYDDFKKYMKSNNPVDMEMLVKRTRPFLMRRTKEKVLKELPAKMENDVYLELTENQKIFYRKTVELIRSDIDDAYRKKTSAQARIIALTALLKLRQICLTPSLLDPSISDKAPKMDFLCMKVRELLDEGHSALVFSQFTSFLDILEKEFVREHIPFSRLDGSTPTMKRKKLVEGFQSAREPSVFLLSLKAGGQGLNLTKASYVFHLDPWWNPAVENQASDRAHRLGQQKKVTITRILMHHTIEEKMMELKKKKLALFKAIMD
ncbi:MAG: SNF2-related protein, partial [Deltaproteobacteria bacterium]|nr:SNF2-related protein [Deltaproteobacteria bacterium]